MNDDAQRALEESNARLSVLAEASRAFAEAATDETALLERIARCTADLIGDGCLVTLLDADGETMLPAATAHRDPARADDYARLVRTTSPALKSTSKTVSADVMRTNTPRVVTSIDRASLLAATDEALHSVVHRLDPSAFVVTPIRSGGAILGTLSLLRTGPGRTYTPADLTLVNDLADRAGLALAAARSHGELERRVRTRTAELEAANEDLEAFSTSVAHDLRAPLSAVLGFAVMLGEEGAAVLDPNLRAHLTEITDAAERMTGIVDALLGMARITAGTVRRERVDLTELGRRIVQTLEHREPTRRVRAHIAPGLTGEGDPALLEIALTNLFNNAWKFTRTRPEAHIELAADAESTFVVRDDGVGFDSRRAERLFLPFARLHQQSEFEGTGIGLATVHRIIGRHGGRVWAESAVGKGASFYFTLPGPMRGARSSAS